MPKSQCLLVLQAAYCIWFYSDLWWFFEWPWELQKRQCVLWPSGRQPLPHCKVCPLRNFQPVWTAISTKPLSRKEMLKWTYPSYHPSIHDFSQEVLRIRCEKETLVGFFPDRCFLSWFPFSFLEKTTKNTLEFPQLSGVICWTTKLDPWWSQRLRSGLAYGSTLESTTSLGLFFFSSCCDAFFGWFPKKGIEFVWKTFFLHLCLGFFLCFFDFVYYRSYWY